MPTPAAAFNPTHLLRVDAVNFDAFLFDTDDLSTIRGGSLLLLDSGKKVQSWLRDFFQETLPPQQPGPRAEEVTPVADKDAPRWRTIVTAASMGIFELALEHGPCPQGLRDHLERKLLDDAQLKHATFVVDVQPLATLQEDDSPAGTTPPTTVTQQCLAALTALNRRRNLGSLSLAVPEWNTELKREPSPLDGLRPAAATKETEDGKPLSLATAVRRRYGREQKKVFYRERSDQPRDFGAMLKDITEDPPEGAKHLDGKIAVIYLDGNQFGARIRDRSTSPEDYRNVSEKVANQRNALLNGLLGHMDGDPTGWINKTGGKSLHRLETLLWGGDEIIWVVPAWKGWETLRFFYETAKDWTLPDKDGQETPLTHSAGLVFASHKAPIQRLTRLARELADKAKKVTDRKENAFACEVLESYDHTGGSLDDYYLSRYRCWEREGGDERNPASKGWMNFGHLTLSGQRMGTIQAGLHGLEAKGDFPSRRLQINVGKVLQSGSMEEALKAVKDDHGLLEKLPDFRRPGSKGSGFSDSSAPFHPAAWLHASLLWDYVARVPLPAAPVPTAAPASLSTHSSTAAAL